MGRVDVAATTHGVLLKIWQTKLSADLNLGNFEISADQAWELAVKLIGAVGRAPEKAGMEAAFLAHTFEMRRLEEVARVLRAERNHLQLELDVAKKRIEELEAWELQMRRRLDDLRCELDCVSVMHAGRQKYEEG